VLIPSEAACDRFRMTQCNRALPRLQLDPALHASFATTCLACCESAAAVVAVELTLSAAGRAVQQTPRAIRGVAVHLPPAAARRTHRGSASAAIATDDLFVAVAFVAD